MARQNRDEFSASTKRQLAARVGYRCSYPDCPTPQTIGAAMSHDGTINVGIAAHITAAAKKGPRYDASLTSAQRSSADNGIWCCTTHGKAIDSDEGSFEVADLRKWKLAAEKASLPHIWTKDAIPGHLIEIDLDQTEVAGLVALGLRADTDLAAVTTRLIAAAREDIANFQNDAQWPVHPVYLGLHVRNENDRFDARQIAAAAEAHRTIVVVAPPGVGKSTTLMQMAAEVAVHGNFVAIFVALPEWSAQQDGFFRSILTRHAFYRVLEGELRLLALFGRLVLFLDGWNELDSVSRRRATEEIDRLRRDYPELGIVLSTRQEVTEVPFGGPTLEIEPLDYDQQREIARAIDRAEGEGLLQRAWETQGVDELVSIPLYLRSLIANSSHASFPTTKEEILRLFVNEHDQARRKAQVLSDVTMGFHANILTGLAVQATQAANTSIPTTVANRVVVDRERQLVADGQITVQPQPQHVLGALTGQHALIVSTPTSYAFQHQQFQEWYASHEVEAVMDAAGAGDGAAKTRLREEFINLPRWEESLLFACERCSRRDDGGVASVANAVVEALGIDPLLAAEMISRSAPAVWERLGGRGVEFAERWAAMGGGNRALSFMVRTGKPEFADKIWPLLAHADIQENRGILRISPVFRTSVLGPDIRGRAAALPEPQRVELLSELAFFGAREVMVLASEMAAQDPSPAVRSSVAEYLIRRRAEPEALAVLEQAPQEVWQALADKGLADQVSDETASARLRALRAATLETATLEGRLQAILNARVDVGRIPEMQAIIEDPDLPLRGMNLRAALFNLSRRYPNAVAESLLRRLERSLQLPYGTERIIQQAGIVIEDGPLVDLIIADDAPVEILKAAAPSLGAGSVGRLIAQRVDRLMAIRREPARPLDRDVTDPLNAVHDALRTTPAKSLAEALLGRPPAATTAEAGILAELLASHGEGGRLQPLGVPPDLVAKARGMIDQWAGLMLDMPDRLRSDMVEVARAMARVPDPEQLPRLEAMVAADLAQWRAAREEYLRTRNVQTTAHTSWTNWYRHAFVAIGEPAIATLMALLDDPLFAFDAAAALSEIWSRRSEPDPPKTFQAGHNFSQARRRRLEREQPPDAEAVDLSKAIFAAVARRLDAPDDDKNPYANLELARAGFALPSTGHDEIVSRLMQGGGGTQAKARLLFSIALSGGVVSATDVLTGLREFLAAAAAKPYLWGERGNESANWLALFAFSDNPEAIFDALAEIPTDRRTQGLLRPSMEAFGHSPDDRAEQILLRFAREKPADLSEEDWIQAVELRQTLGAAAMLLDLLVEGAVGERLLQFSSKAQHILAGAMNADPAFRAVLYDRYRNMEPGRAKELLSHAIAEVPDETGILVLFDGYMQAGRRFHGPLELAIHNITRFEASDETGSAVYVYSRPLPDLRRALFDKTAEKSQTAVLARQCLQLIDRMRDVHGAVDSEPRHPNIASGRDWPILDG